MKFTGSNERTKKMVLFSLAFAVAMLLVFLLGASLRDGGEKQTVDSSDLLFSQTGKLISTNERLQQQFASLQQLDGQYAAAITDPAFASRSDSLNKLIAQEEINFRNAVEAAGQESAAVTDENIKKSFEKMLAAYRTLIDNRRAISSLRNVVAMQNSHLAPDEKAMLQLQDELMEKNNRIAALENTARQMMKTKEVTPVKNDNGGLQQKISTLQNEISILTGSNTSLKQDNERLLKQQGDVTKNTGSTEQMLKEKNNALQQKVDDLNAEIQLVKVDCNLSRVDATQIISNAKQRKQLLNEASDILTNLSFSGNAAINRRVKEKVNRLNQVAANSRE